MSFGVEIFTGISRNKISTKAGSKVPSKVLGSIDFPGFRPADCGIYNLDIGVPHARAELALITFDGSTLNSGEEEIPGPVAYLKHDQSSGNIIAVDVQIPTWGGYYYGDSYIDMHLWILGE